MATRAFSDAVWYDRGAILRRVPGGTVHLTALDDGSVVVDDFLLDAAPVTVRRYARFLGLFGAHIPEPLDWARQLRTPDLPVTGVGPDEAAAFATFVGGRLPTVWEWQRAARGRFGLAAAPLGEPFGVGGLCQRWEWTQTPAPAGFWVCGGRYRDRPDDVADVDHLAFETRAAVDVGFRVAHDALAPGAQSLPEPGPLLLPERTRVTPWSPSSTAPLEEPAVPPPPPPPTPTRSPPAHDDEVLAAMWATPPRASWRCGDVVVLDELREPRPALETEHRAIWLRSDGSRSAAGLTAMWSERVLPMAPRVEARLQWHALREGRSPTQACAFHVVDGREGVMPVFVERVVAGVRLRHVLDALGARGGDGRMPLEVAVSFALHVLERSVMPGSVVVHDDVYGSGQLAWDGTWHPRFDVAEPGGRGRIGQRAEQGLLDGPPEAILGHHLDDRARTCRAANLLYRLLTGARPWMRPADDTSFVRWLQAAIEGERIPIATLRPDLGAAVAAVIDDAVAIDRERRPGFEELLGQLRAWLEPGFAADATVAPADTAAFMAALMADLFPRTREAQLAWWEEAAFVDVAGAPTAPGVTLLPSPSPSTERLMAALGEVAARNEVVT
jgi:hypothetical protein